MSEQKPLRQEEYAAMAEELRRAKAENEAFKRNLARGPFPWKRVGIAVGIAMILALLPGLGVAVFGNKNVELPPEQKHPCYFVRHHLQDEDGEPWEKWHVFRSGCKYGCNRRIDLEPQTPGVVVEPTFDTKAEAWTFIQNWKLEACR